MESKKFISRHNRLCAIGLAICLTTFGATACSQQPDAILGEGKKLTEQKKEIIYLDVAVFSYIERPIFDVYLNGKDIGVAAGQPHRGEANGLITGVPVILGPQMLTWRDAGTGENFRASNQPVLLRPEKGKHYLGVHIYPDNTVELVTTTYWPEKTAKGEEINRRWETAHGR